jgi:hypothetical protein
MLLFPLFILPLFAWAWGWRRGARYGLITLATSLLVVSPWVIHNTIKYKTLFPLQTNNALLWQGSPEYYHLVRDEGYTYARVWSEVVYGPDWQAHDPTSIPGDRYWTRRALSSIAAEPLVYLRFAGEKLFTYWVGDPNADWGDTHVFNYPALRAAGISPYIAMQIMIARALPIAAVVALIILRRQGNRLRPLVIILVYFTLLHAATHAEVRLSEPLLPLLLVITAAALVQLASELVYRLAPAEYPPRRKQGDAQT